jgi:hypothetical protein
LGTLQEFRESHNSLQKPLSTAGIGVLFYNIYIFIFLYISISPAHPRDPCVCVWGVIKSAGVKNFGPFFVVSACKTHWLRFRHVSCKRLETPDSSRNRAFCPIVNLVRFGRFTFPADAGGVEGRGCLPFGLSTCARCGVYNSLFRCSMGSHGVSVPCLPARPDPQSRPALPSLARRVACSVPAALRALCWVRQAAGCHPGRAVIGSPPSRWNLNQTPRPDSRRGGTLPLARRTPKNRARKNRHPPENIFFKFRLFALDKPE